MGAYFIYNGISSKDMGVILKKLPPITKPKKRIEIVQVPGKNGTLHIDENCYEPINISLECTLKKNINVRDITKWLIEFGTITFSDELDKYYVEFEYDGLRFTNIPANIEFSNDNYSITSKAVEEETGRGDRKDRKSVNADFSEITNGKSRNNGKEVYTLDYDYYNHVSTYRDNWGYKYNANKQYCQEKFCKNL